MERPVNCFETEAMRKLVVLSMGVVLSARPV